MLTCDFVSKRASKALAVMEAKKFNALAAQFGAGTMSDKEKLGLVEVRAGGEGREEWGTFQFPSLLQSPGLGAGKGGEVGEGGRGVAALPAHVEEYIEEGCF